MHLLIINDILLRLKDTNKLGSEKIRAKKMGLFTKLHFQFSIGISFF
ncbi:hypothetical protein EVA_11232 [gut metagenome]|uniref:Uncharacterized protein n=1 Tax=gut metagenome TaxID=749906 RepID=J9G1E6_9ZZZZ